MARIQTPLPDRYSGQLGTLNVYEEEGTVWLWAYPILLDWPCEIVWIDSPVVGNTRWPGDLWGVDRQGELILVEMKRAGSADPFEDFLSFHDPSRREIRAEELLKRWQRQHKAELRFPHALAERPAGQTAGLLPRSRHRFALRRWPYLAGLIDAQIRSPVYVEKVQAYLNRRAKQGNPLPHYVGWLVRAGQGRRGQSPLSPKGWRSMAKLQGLAGRDRVWLYTVTVEVRTISEREVVIESSRQGADSRA